MTATLGILALLVSDVALPGANPSGMPAMMPPTRQQPSNMARPGAGYMPGRAQRTPGYAGPGAAGPGATGMPMQIPYAPTERDAEQSVYPMGTPTSSLEPANGEPVSSRKSSLLDYPNLWRTPTTPPNGPRRDTRPPLQPFGASTLGGPSTEQDFIGFSPYAARASRQLTEEYPRAAAVIGAGAFEPSGKKPFSSYQRGSAVSPYMNLFRNDNDFGRVDNYSTLVRPRIQQMNENRQAARSIRGLQSNSRVQGSAIQRIGTKTGTIPRSTGQFFNNKQRFYPGFGR